MNCIKKYCVNIHELCCLWRWWIIWCIVWAYRKDIKDRLVWAWLTKIKDSCYFHSPITKILSFVIFFPKYPVFQKLIHSPFTKWFLTSKRRNSLISWYGYKGYPTHAIYPLTILIHPIRKLKTINFNKCAI